MLYVDKNQGEKITQTYFRNSPKVQFVLSIETHNRHSRRHDIESVAKGAFISCTPKTKGALVGRF